ncbi:MAG: UDP-N-acetylmuramoyl-L-alanyl-D-glutamate--2,6-diaminopimelate ligase [Planctomycetota bacterium]|nr:UDP-N-acetylmuramoyl-L-alanyl-D-glutamate--2,6-diaminopimelate ligase [Planctomycetota bacterium]
MRLDHLASAASLRLDRTSCGHDVEISGVADDSRQVVPGTLFVVRPGSGSADPMSFVADAISRGAVAVAVPSVWESCEAVQGCAVPVMSYQLVQGSAAIPTAAIADAFWTSPASQLRTVGITGTNGKTTIAFLYQQLSRAAGRRCGLMGTVRTDDGVQVQESALTTPGRIELTRTLARMVSNRCDDLAMEVSSHALAQGRVEGINFGCAIFTNLTGDHLDFHGTMDQYADAKAKLFEGLSPSSTAIVNADDPACDRMLSDCRARVLRCSLVRHDTESFAQVRATGVHGMDLVMHGPWGALDVSIPLLGTHNAMNALQAMAAAWSQGVPAKSLDSAIRCCTAPPGRLEPASGPDDDIGVYVDYAHTDDAMRNVLQACRPCVGSGSRLVVVFGCGGDRDRTKRPRMAQAACELADRVWVTSDNPRTEVPESVVAEVLVGVPVAAASNVSSEVDRSKAIAAAVADARAGDLIVIAGKGHENYQIVGTTKRPFDDRVEAIAALRARRACRSVAAGRES